MSRKALGRGLRALIPESDSFEAAVRSIPIDQIDRNPEQPRKLFDDEQLEELKESILAHGVLEPIIVRPIEGRYEIVVGERRWRAAKLAGLESIPAAVRPLSDREAMEMALVENLQREDLNPIEEAEAYKRLMDEFELTQEQVADRVGKKRSTVANRLRLLEMEPELRAEVAAGRLSAGHAKALLAISSPRERAEVARRVIEEGWSVRAVEEYSRQGDRKRSSSKRAVVRKTRDPLLQDIEERLQRCLGTKVRVVGRGQRGRIEIDYYSEDDMERILEIIAGGKQ